MQRSAQSIPTCREGQDEGISCSHFNPDPSLEQETEYDVPGLPAKPDLLVGHRKEVSSFYLYPYTGLSVQQGHCGKNCQQSCAQITRQAI